MSKILLIVAAVLLLGSSALSFVNKGKLTASLEDAKTAHADATAAHADAEKKQKSLVKAQADLKDSEQKASDAQGQLASAQSQVTDLTGKLDIATKAAAEKEAQIADANKKVQEALAKVGSTGNPDDIAKQIGELTRQRDELQVVKEGLDAQLKASQTQLAASAKKERDRQQGILMNGLVGQVLAVDRNWNFVVLNLGDQRGVNNNAVMVVQRNGSLVGRVRITSVEPTQSIADIIPNSVPPGVSVQAGDTVVFPGT